MSAPTYLKQAPTTLFIYSASIKCLSVLTAVVDAKDTKTSKTFFPHRDGFIMLRKENVLVVGSFGICPAVV